VDALLSIEDICDSWGVLPPFVRRHAQYQNHAAKTLPPLEGVIVEKKLYFSRDAVRAFFKALKERRKVLATDRKAA